MKKIIVLACLQSGLSYADTLSSSNITLADGQYNSSSWAAKNLIDNDPSTKWLSSKHTNDINFQLSTIGDALCLANFDLTNYGSNGRGVKQFVLLTTEDDSLSADAGTQGWQPLVADETPTGYIDYLSWAQGARLMSVNSQYNATNWAAKHINDGSLASRWLSRKSNNIMQYQFDTDWDGTNGDGITINEIEVSNYGNDDRSVKEFQVEITSDGTTWRKLQVPGTDAGDLEYNYTRYQDGGILAAVDSQYNATNWRAGNVQDGDQNSRWLSRKGNNTLAFTFDPNHNGISGADGDIADVFAIDKINLENYGNDDRSVNEFQLAVKTLANPNWHKINAPGALIGELNYNFALSHHGGKLSSIDSQYNSTNYGADNIHDGDQNTQWLSRKGNNELSFQFDADEDGVPGSIEDLFTLNSIYLRNYGNDDRAIKAFQIAVKTSINPNWEKITVPGAVVGQADYNFALSHHGGVLTAINSQYNSTNYAADNIHDGDENSRWMSRKGNNTLDFQFDTNEDGVRAAVEDRFTLESFYLANYGNDDRAIKDFQIEVKTASNSNWTKLPVSGSTANTPDYNYALSAHGGSLTLIDSEYNSTSWGAKNIHDGDTNSRWMSSKPNNTLVFSFDSNFDGVIGDAINLDTIALTNYGNDDRSVQTFEVDVQILSGVWQTLNAPSGGTVFTANMNRIEQTWAITPQSNVTAVKLRTLTNYGDASYTGASEFTLSGTTTGQSYTYTAAMHGNGETFTLAALDQPIGVTDVRLRTINNYGDPYYTGAKEFKLLGASVTETKTFQAAMHGNGETFTLDANDIATDITDVKFITINNHGDPSYVGARELKLQGPSVTETKTFTAAMQSEKQTFQLDANDIPFDVTDVKLITISNHGDPSYLGLREFEVVGKSVTAASTFTLPMQSAPFNIALDNDDTVSGIIGARLVTIRNHGDAAYTGLADVKLLGTAITPSYIFSAEDTNTVQSYNLPPAKANTFRFHSLNNHGNSSYIGAAEFALNADLCAPAFAQYAMEEPLWNGALGEVIDSSGNFHAQAFNGATTINVSPALTGNPGTCRYGTFDGIDDYIQLDDNAQFDLLTELTVSVWIKPETLPSSGLKTIISKDENYEFHLQPTGEINWWWKTQSFSTSGAGITAGNWYHIAITYTSGRQVIYVNGVEKGSRAFTGNLVLNNDPLQIGQDQGFAGRYFHGDIDEVKFFDIALNAAEVNDIYAERHPCVEPVIHHYEIVHDGNGLTCAAEPITIKACTNSDCSSLSGLSTEAVSLDFTVTSPTGGTLVKASPTFTGSTSFSFNHTSAENVTLSINGATISASHAIECSGAGNSCDISFADAGYIITLGDHKACTRPDLIIQAVKLADNGVSCAPAYIGDQAVDFTFNYSNPNTGTQLPLLNNMAMAANGIAQSRVVTFDANAKALLPFQYHDAGQINVAVKQGSGAGLASANVTALVTPDHIAIKAVDATASCTSADANDPSCHKFKVAGEDFAIEVGAYCADGSTLTPNFKLDDIVLSHNLIAPAGKALGKLGNKSIDIIDNGVAVISDQSISEVGVFTITATPPNGGYFGQTILPATSENMGRFVPDYFAVNTVFEGELLNVNGNSFAYTGEMNNANLANGAILYRPLMEPEILLTAKNIAGETTENYTDDFMKLSDSSFTITAPTTDTVQLGRDNLNKTQVAAGINILPENLTDKGNGTIEYQFNETDNFYYTRNENALVDSYPADIELHISAIADDDMVKAKYIDDLAVNGVVTLAPQGLDIRFGRWNIENTYGPETSNLVLPMSAQYWNGIKFVSNPLDKLTPYDGNLAGNYSKSNTGLSPQLNIGVVNVSGAGPFDLGLGQLLLSQPTNGAQGQIRITYETVPSWLKFNWNSVDEGSDGNIFDDNPSGVATFGRYRGNDRIISWREVSN